MSQINMYHIVGSGKSTIVAELISTLRSMQHCRIAYVFCNSSEPESVQLESVLRSLVVQLFLQTQFKNMNPFQEITPPLRIDEIISLFRLLVGSDYSSGKGAAAEQIAECTYVIVDGIDAMGATDAGQLTSILEKSYFGTRLKILVTNQEGPPRHRERKGLNLDEARHKLNDVSKFIEQEIDRKHSSGAFQFGKEKAPDIIKYGLTASADGK